MGRGAAALCCEVAAEEFGGELQAGTAAVGIEEFAAAIETNSIYHRTR